MRFIPLTNAGGLQREGSWLLPTQPVDPPVHLFLAPSQLLNTGKALRTSPGSQHGCRNYLREIITRLLSLLGFCLMLYELGEKSYLVKHWHVLLG